MSNRPPTSRVAFVVAWIAAAFAFAPSSAAVPGDDADSLDAAAIVKRALTTDALGIRDGEATLQLVIKDDRGHILERTLRSRSQRYDGERRTRITFTEPADQRGVEVLLLEERDGPDAQYLWLPRLGERRRIADTSKGARFEGSDFTWADLERRGPGKGTLERLPDATWGGQEVYRVDITPPAGEAATGPYGKVSLWVGKRIWVPLRIAFYDRAGAPLKELRVKRVQKLGTRYAPVHLVMEDLAGGGTTEVRVLAYDADRSFPPSVFSPESLGR